MNATMTNSYGEAVTVDFDEQFGRIKAEYNRLLHCAEIAEPSKRYIFVNAARAQIYRTKLLFEDFGLDSGKENIIKALRQ